MKGELSSVREGRGLTEPSPEFVEHIPYEFARRHLIVSVGRLGEVERVAVASTTSPGAVFNVAVRLSLKVETQVEEGERLAARIDEVYGAGPNQVESGRPLVRSAMDPAIDAEQDLLRTDGKAPAVQLVDLLIFEALCQGASDIHIQPLRERTLVRVRVDGALITTRELSGDIASAVVQRIKVMASLDVAERRAPQDGRAGVTVGSTRADGRRVDLRISTLPSTYGERVVMRLLDPSRAAHLLNFAALGMPEAVEITYKSHVGRASGIVLSTGPTGSGKTTTLYTTLAWLTATTTGNKGEAGEGANQTRPRVDSELNIMTVEDPVEYDLSHSGLTISQTQVDPRKGMTFASGLRHVLRQDPDVIMVGEIRDAETARIAVQASLTGHLVLSTLHTTDAAGAVTRLLDLTVEPFLVASSLSAVLAQRLVRRVHAACRGEGCEECLRTGLRGRTGLFELLVVDDRLRSLIGQRAPSPSMRDAAIKGGMKPLAAHGHELIKTTITTPREVARVLDAVDELEGVL